MVVISSRGAAFSKAFTKTSTGFFFDFCSIREKVFSTTAYIIVEKTFSLIEQKSKKNPVEVFVKALENAAPREEITTIEYGGARYPKAVECAPQRRVDYALRLMVQGAYAASFGKKKSIEEALSEEIIKAYNMDQGSVALSKKLELERQSDASR